MWLTAIPSDTTSTLAPDLMHVAMRRRLRLPLPLTALHCGAEGRQGCGAEVDAYGGPPTSPAPTRACCPGVIPSSKGRGFRSLAGRSVRKVESCRNSGCRAQQRRRFTPTTVAASNFVVYGATNNGEALCCDAIAKFRKKGCELRELRN